jgi:hypothetical protein
MNWLAKKSHCILTPQPCKKHCATQIQEKRHTRFKAKCNKVWWAHVLGVKLLGSGKFHCLAIFNGWLLKLFYFFQYWCDFDLIVVHSYLILCCVEMMMGSG